MNNQFGKTSKFQLSTAFKDGKTVVKDISFTAPFKFMNPFYEKKDFMTVMLLTASAGIMAGDRQELDICVGKHSKVEFVSQAYEKIHKMDEGFAKRYMHIAVRANACLHYMPLPTIPFADSDYRCKVDVELEDESSQFIFSEILCCGRVAYGEEFKYSRFENKICIYQKGELVYRDNTCYEPQKMDMRGFGMYEGYTHLANVVICNKQKSEDFILQVRNLLDSFKDIDGGVTKTFAGHIVVRILGKNAQQLTEVIEKIIS